jgi:hypothetical protein
MAGQGRQKNLQCAAVLISDEPEILGGDVSNSRAGGANA